MSGLLNRIRVIGLAGLGLCGVSMAFAVYFLEGYLYLDPCPLCLVDRAIVISLGVVFLLAALHGPAGALRYLYAVAVLLCSGLGIASAGRHIWLQGLPPDQVPACGPHLYYMLENFPLKQVFDTVLQGSGSCADVQWTFLGLTLPQQTLLLFLVMAALGVAMALPRKQP